MGLPTTTSDDTEQLALDVVSRMRITDDDDGEHGAMTDDDMRAAERVNAQNSVLARECAYGLANNLVNATGDPIEFETVSGATHTFAPHPVTMRTRAPLSPGVAGSLTLALPAVAAAAGKNSFIVEAGADAAATEHALALERASLAAIERFFVYTAAHDPVLDTASMPPLGGTECAGVIVTADVARALVTAGESPYPDAAVRALRFVYTVRRDADGVVRSLTRHPVMI